MAISSPVQTSEWERKKTEKPAQDSQLKPVGRFRLDSLPPVRCLNDRDAHPVRTLDGGSSWGVGLRWELGLCSCLCGEQNPMLGEARKILLFLRINGYTVQLRY